MKNLKTLFISSLTCLAIGTFAFGVAACGDNSNSASSSDSMTEEEWNESATQELGYKLSSDETYYILNGMGFCEEEDIIIPSIHNDKPVKEINDFSGDEGIKTIKIPKSIRKISASFASCENLQSIEVQSGSEYFKSIDGNLYDDEGKEFIRYAIGKTATEFTIPDGVTKVAKNAFKGNKNLKELTVCDTYTTAEAGVFTYLDGITEMTFEGLTKVAEDMFCDAEDLESVRFNTSITEIGESAFAGCESLTSIKIPASVTSIGKYAFARCVSLHSVYIDTILSWCNIEFGDETANPLQYYDYNASARTLYVNGTKLSGALIIPDSVQKLSEYAFYGQSGVTSVTIGKGVKKLGDQAFGGMPNVSTVNYNAEECILTTSGYLSQPFDDLGKNTLGVTVNIGATVKKVPAALFQENDKVKKVTFSGTSCKEIGNSAFQYCDNLSELTLPSSLITIGESAFRFTNIQTIVIPASVREIKEDAFGYLLNGQQVTFENPNGWYAVRGNEEYAVEENLLKSYLSDGWRLIKK